MLYIIHDADSAGLCGVLNEPRDPYGHDGPSVGALHATAVRRVIFAGADLFRLSPLCTFPACGSAPTAVELLVSR